MVRTRLVVASLIMVGAVFYGSVQMGTVDHSARAVVRDAAGNVVGEVEFTQELDKVSVEAEFRGLPAGWHGFHIHGVGDCTPPGHTSAGAHWNPAMTTHPNHAGDMPLLFVNADGTAEAEFLTDRFTVASLFDADGSAVIIHGDADNYANVPARYAPTGPDTTTLGTGDAGARIACGVIRQ